MKKMNKFLCVLMAAVLCFLAVGCARKADDPISDGKILSNTDIETLSDELVKDYTTEENKHLTLGAYNGAELNWTVVNVNSEGYATLLCDTVVDAQPFNTTRDISKMRDDNGELYVMNWETSSLRAWLNETFLTSAFSDEESACIYGGELVTVNNPVTDRGECTTEDKVFILSADEAKAFLEDDAARVAQPASGVSVRTGATDGSGAVYWLRSSGESMWHASAINTDGSVNYSGMTVQNTRIGVRPCIRLKSTVPGGEQAVSVKSAVKGNIVAFGTYEQDGDGASAEPILWRVLDIEGTSKLLCSVDVLDYAKFNAALDGSKWADSDLREWLNGDFFTTAFTAEEQGAVVAVTNSTADNADYVVDSGADSEDKVFVMSKEEFETYLSGEVWALAKASEYSQNREVTSEDGSKVSLYEHGVQVDPNYGTCGYWLRNAGQNDISAMYVYYYGDVNTEGSLVRNTFLGVRPCIWVNVGE